MFQSLRICFFSFVLCVFLGTHAQSLEVPKHTGFIVDQTKTLSRSEIKTLSSSLKQFQLEYGPQIQVLMVKSLEGQPLEDFTIRVAEKWKLGDAKRDDGVLVFVSMEDRKLRIEVGGGLEGQLPDALAGRIVHDGMIPLFKQGNVSGGLLVGLSMIAKSLGGELRDVPVYRTRSKRRRGSSSLFLIFLLLFLFLPRIGGRGTRSGMLTGFLLGGMMGGGFRGGGGFGGGGFGGGFGGGGGGFSGGGASGSW